jgi:hypothetical protein
MQHVFSNFLNCPFEVFDHFNRYGCPSIFSTTRSVCAFKLIPPHTINYSLTAMLSKICSLKPFIASSKDSSTPNCEIYTKPGLISEYKVSSVLHDSRICSMVNSKPAWRCQHVKVIRMQGLLDLHKALYVRIAWKQGHPQHTLTRSFWKEVVVKNIARRAWKPKTDP